MYHEVENTDYLIAETRNKRNKRTRGEEEANVWLMEPEEGPENVIHVQLAGTQLVSEDSPDEIRQLQVWASVCLGTHQTFLRQLHMCNARIPGFFDGDTLLYAAEQLDLVVNSIASSDMRHVVYAMQTVMVLANNGPPDLEWAASWDAFSQTDKDAVRTYTQNLSFALRMHVD